MNINNFEIFTVLRIFYFASIECSMNIVISYSLKTAFLKGCFLQGRKKNCRKEQKITLLLPEEHE